MAFSANRQAFVTLENIGVFIQGENQRKKIIRTSIEGFNLSTL